MHNMPSNFVFTNADDAGESVPSKHLTIFSTFYVLTKIAGRGQETATSKYLTMDGTFLLTYSLKLQAEVRRLQQVST